jgi:hypothetical protein
MNYPSRGDTWMVEHGKVVRAVMRSPDERHIPEFGECQHVREVRSRRV